MSYLPLGWSVPADKSKSHGSRDNFGKDLGDSWVVLLVSTQIWFDHIERDHNHKDTMKD